MSNRQAKVFRDCPVEFVQEVAWGDMDAFGHVNNVLYYRYIESARLAYLMKIKAFDGGLASVVAANSCRYLRPLFYPDQLRIGVQVVELRNSGFRMTYQLHSTQQDQLVATAEAIVVMTDAETGEKAALPAELRQRIMALEGSVGHELESAEPEKLSLGDLRRAIKDNLEHIVPKIVK